MKKNILCKIRLGVLLIFAVISCNCTKLDEIEDKPNGPDDIVDSEDYISSSEFIAVFGDIQYITNGKYIDIFKRSLDWIENAKKKINISCVLHTGDISASNSVASEWPYFKRCMEGFSLSFISCIGDHDYKWNDNIFINNRYDTHFSEYTKFPLVTKRIEASFEANRMENIVVHNEIHGERYDLLVLEFGPRKEVVEWAKDWVESHPDVKYILMNHEYLEQGGGRRTSGLKCKARLRNTDCMTPDELWAQLVKCNNNIVCVLCGHVGGLYAVTYEENDFGREVCQIQHNIQSPDYRYDNWLMMWEFPEEGDEANVFIVNTKTEELYDSKESLFTFKYRY